MKITIDQHRLDEGADKISQAVNWCHRNLEPETWHCHLHGLEVNFKFDRDEDYLMFVLGNDL